MATDYYINSETGDDSKDGKSKANAWKTLEQMEKGNYTKQYSDPVGVVMVVDDATRQIDKWVKV